MSKITKNRVILKVNLIWEQGPNFYIGFDWGKTDCTN